MSVVSGKFPHCLAQYLKQGDIWEGKSNKWWQIHKYHLNKEIVRTVFLQRHVIQLESLRQNFPEQFHNPSSLLSSWLVSHLLTIYMEDSLPGNTSSTMIWSKSDLFIFLSKYFLIRHHAEYQGSKYWGQGSLWLHRIFYWVCKLLRLGNEPDS